MPATSQQTESADPNLPPDGGQTGQSEEKSTRSRLFFRLLRPYIPRLLGAASLTIFLSILAMIPPLVVRGMIDEVIVNGHREWFGLFAAGLLLIPLMAVGCRLLQTLCVAYVSQYFVFDLRRSLYAHLLGLSSRFYGRESAGKLVNRLMGDSGVVQTVLTAQSISVLSDLVCAAFAISATFAINWRLALVVLLLAVTFVVNYQINIRRIRDATRSYKGSMDRLSGGIQNRLSAAVAVKTFGMENSEHEVFRQDLSTSLDQVQEAMTATNTFTMNTQLLQQCGRVVVYFLGCAMVLRGTLSYGSVVAFTAYAMQLLMPAVRFSQIARQFQDVRIALDRLLELFMETPEIQNASNPVILDPSKVQGEVIFDHVFFHYNPENPVLRNLCLTVKPGMTVALIGPTGCGKSTIISLLLRFFDVCGGEIRLDGTDLRQIELRSLRRCFGIVLQEPMLFQISIAENIGYSRPNASRSEIEDAARAAEIHDFIRTLPKGYDTIIGEEGMELSVGQRQRITIARAILADPAILIMDEATSALDSDSEYAIQKAIERILRGRTSFIVAHRLSTISNADLIVLLKDGEIAEMGTHDQLMANPDGMYLDLYEKHMGHDLEDQ